MEIPNANVIYHTSVCLSLSLSLSLFPHKWAPLLMWAGNLQGVQNNFPKQWALAKWQTSYIINLSICFLIILKIRDSQVHLLSQPTKTRIWHDVEHIWSIMEHTTTWIHNSRTRRYDGSQGFPFIKSPPKTANLSICCGNSLLFFLFSKIKKIKKNKKTL